jgi:mono/diheme cytochrome c family protein
MSETGFVLPEGDVDAGRQAFLDLQCNQCHTIKGEDLPLGPLADPPYVELGGLSTTVKTYGQLVTAITSPSRDLAAGYLADKVSEDGESNMYDFNRQMTVQQLTDLVRFLQPHYEVIRPPRTARWHY